jgi:hypothetical protein
MRKILSIAILVALISMSATVKPKPVCGPTFHYSAYSGFTVTSIQVVQPGYPTITYTSPTFPFTATYSSTNITITANFSSLPHNGTLLIKSGATPVDCAVFTPSTPTATLSDVLSCTDYNLVISAATVCPE